MVRDLDLVRKILLELEKARFQPGWIDLEIDGYSPEQVAYHVALLADKGLIEAQELTTFDSPWPDWRPIRLTGQGHDFLDDIRNDSVWKKVKEKVASEAGGASLAIVKGLATMYAKQYFGLE